MYVCARVLCLCGVLLLLLLRMNWCSWLWLGMPAWQRPLKGQPGWKPRPSGHYFATTVAGRKAEPALRRDVRQQLAALKALPEEDLPLVTAASVFRKDEIDISVCFVIPFPSLASKPFVMRPLDSLRRAILPQTSSAMRALTYINSRQIVNYALPAEAKSAA